MDEKFLIECMQNEIENSYFDFKKDIYDFSLQKGKEDLLTDILSFANGHTKGNKYIIMGVKLKPDGTRDFFGVTESKIKDGADYQSLINDNIEPNIIVDFTVFDYDGKKYAVFRINEENRDRPYMLSKKYGNLYKGYIKIRKGQKNDYITRNDFDLFYKEKNLKEISNIKVKGIINGMIDDRYILNKSDTEIDVELAHERINELFTQIKNIDLVGSYEGIKLGYSLSIKQKYKSSIINYAKENNIELEDDFFDIGNITYFTIMTGRTSYYGSDSEKQKYKLICELGKLILIFKAYLDFFEKIDKIYYTELVIENNGKKFDEDVEVILRISKNSFLEYNQFPIPNEFIINKMLDSDFLKKNLEIKKINDVNSYISKYPQIPPIPPTSLTTIDFGRIEPAYDDYKEYYKECVNNIADYEITSDQDYYYIKFEQKEIKPNEVIALPSRLFFKEIPEFICYKIKTKHNPNIQEGKVLIKDSQ